MPIHDWTRVDANLFHHFHQAWTMNIADALNGGLLPKGYSALVEQHAGGLVPDVIALQRRSGSEPPEPRGGAVVSAAPNARHVLWAAYVADLPKTAYVEPVGVGDVLPDGPAYLDADSYVPVPLEATYRAAWARCPEDMREAIEHGLPLSDEPPA